MIQYALIDAVFKELKLSKDLFTQSQLEIISEYIEDLHLKDVAILANPLYSAEQMDKVAFALKYLNDEAVGLICEYAHDVISKTPAFTPDQMIAIILGFMPDDEFENPLTYEQVDAYAEPELSAEIMNTLRMSYSQGLTTNYVKEIATSFDNPYSFEQVQALVSVQASITNVEFEKLLNPKFSPEQIFAYAEGFQEIDPEIMDKLLAHNLSSDEIKQYILLYRVTNEDYKDELNTFLEKNMSALELCIRRFQLENQL